MDVIIIIGTGIAGYTLAREFRKLDKESPLVLLSADDGRSYPKPMLSNALSKGKTADQIAMFDVEAMSKTLNAKVVTNCVVSKIDRENKTVETTDGKSFLYKSLVLAVGAQPIPLQINGDAANEILTINNLHDYSTFRQQLATADHVALIGPGLIGCEFANDMVSATDVRVSVIGPSALPMDTILPEQLAAELKLQLEDAGVKWHLNTTTTKINHGDNGLDLTLANGEIINADVVVSAIGLRANSDLASQAGLSINRGIVTDNYLQTSDPNIYALGDCAEVAGHNLLFIAPIMAAAKSLAKTLAGERVPVKYAAMPVAVKTPLYPLIVAQPPRGARGEWQFENADSGFGVKALFVDDSDALLGFVLSGDAVVDKQALSKRLPDVL